MYAFLEVACGRENSNEPTVGSLLRPDPPRARDKLLPAPARARFDEARAAYGRGDDATALRELRPLAEQGNVDAQFQLGRIDDHGYEYDGLSIPEETPRQ